MQTLIVKDTWEGQTSTRVYCGTYEEIRDMRTRLDRRWEKNMLTRLPNILGRTYVSKNGQVRSYFWF